ncbi:hypothetical protein GQ43DRAFT_413115 [Delitschia confertaspora ATCC 74209]|uniref:Uncharacterized protein n=1 Tax=Delitschia confertaspora ATCC 74209 TaxID=1513339 RepID=A0A9P4N0C3_9PLEO|nr:hypothetical protein GQ43DRAFT_413115 [Delitschia confertaspora ATCC 74209]
MRHRSVRCCFIRSHAHIKLLPFPPPSTSRLLIHTSPISCRPFPSLPSSYPFAHNSCTLPAIRLTSAMDTSQYLHNANAIPNTALAEKPRISTNAAAWRHHQKPNRVITAAKELCPPLVNWRDIEAISTTLSSDSGASVVVELSRQGLNFLIYGQGVPLEEAIKVTNKWIENSQGKSGPSAGWAKQRAFIQNEWYENEVKLIEMERKMQFKRAPPEGEEFLHKVTVEWSDDLQVRGVTCRDAFGLQLEALDIIRTADEVYISLNSERGAKPAIDIVGHNLEGVQEAEQHLRNMVNKVKAKYYDCEPMYIIIDEAEGSKVAFKPAQDWPVPTSYLVPKLIVDLVMQGNDKRTSYQQALAEEQLVRMQHELRCCFEAIRFQRAAFEFSIRYGCFEVQPQAHRIALEGKTFDLDKFGRSLSTGVTMKPVVRRWFGDRQLENQLLGRLMNANHLLEPIASTGGGWSVGFTASSLQDVRPTLRGTWFLQEVGKRHTRQDIVVQIRWTEVQDNEGMYEKHAPQFFKLMPDQELPKDYLDINLVELVEGRAWHFGLEAMIAIPKAMVSPVMTSFANGIYLKKDLAKNINSTAAWVGWHDSPSIQILNGRLDRIYTFGIKETDYQVQAMAMWYRGSKQPGWGLKVQHKDWNMHLGQLETLPPGHSAEFGDSIKNFFPDTGGRISSRGDEPNVNVTANLMELLNMDEAAYKPASTGIRFLVKALAELSQVINGC